LRGGVGRRGERRKKHPWKLLCFQRTRSNPPPPDATRSACLPACRPHPSQCDQSPRCDRRATPRSTSSRHAPPRPTRCSAAAGSAPKVASLNLTRRPPTPRGLPPIPCRRCTRRHGAARRVFPQHKRAERLAGGQLVVFFGTEEPRGNLCVGGEGAGGRVRKERGGG